MQASLLVFATLALFSLAVSGKTVKFTYYWIAVEDDYAAGSDAVVKGCNGAVIARVSAAYLKSLRQECSGRLRGGQYVNGGNGDCSCFDKVSGPVGTKDNALEPFITIATKAFPFGTKVMIDELKGVKLPNGKIHNGCVRVDDVPGGPSLTHVDFYCLSKANYSVLSKALDSQATASANPSCVLQKY